MSTLEMTRLLADVTLVLSAGILLYFMVAYVRFVIAENYQHGWWLIALGSLAAMIYGVSGAVASLMDNSSLLVYRRGASLFFLLFMALGIRTLSEFAGDREINPSRNIYRDYTGLILVAIAWWAAFLFGTGRVFAYLQGLAWLAAVLLASLYGIQVVSRFEGTSLSAVIRHLLPSVICLGVIVIVEMIQLGTGEVATLSDSVSIVGTVLMAAFLFNTAVAIKQEESELHRIYDRTTWQN